MLGSEIVWNGVPFGFIRGLNSHLPVYNFRHTSAVKIEADEETGLSKVTGRELQTCELTIRATDLPSMPSELRANPMLTFRALDLLKGVSGGIFVASGVRATLSQTALDALQTSDWRKIFSLEGATELGKQLLFGSRLGGCQFMLTKVELEAQGTHANGKIYDAFIHLGFVEDAAQSQTGGLVVYVNDKDVTSSIALHAGTYESHAEGEADSLSLTFADTKDQWQHWKPSDSGDTVKVTDGALNTGKMYIDKIEPVNGKYRLVAYSIPKKMWSKRSESYSSLSLPQLASRIAKRHSLEAKLYSVPEVACAYAQQRSESDLAFLQRQCERAGCAFLVFDGKLCLYSQAAIEGREPSKTLTPDFSASVKVTSDAQAAYSSIELRNGTYTGTARDSGVTTGKELREVVTASWANQNDANAAAAARLRQINKGTQCAEAEMPIQRQLAAGSVVRLICKGWAGSAFIYRCRHDLGEKRSKIWFRKPLSF